MDPTTDTVYVTGWDQTGAGAVWALNGANGQPLGGPIAIGPPSETAEGPDAIAVDLRSLAAHVGRVPVS